MSKKFLIIMCGYPYSGKTTLAKELERKLNIQRITVDEILVFLGYKLGVILSEKDWNKIYEVSETKLINLLKNGKSIIFDATNGYKEYRDHLREISKEYKVIPIVIYVDTPLKIIEKRKNDIRERHKAVNFLETVSNFSKPNSDENTIIYHQPGSFEHLLKSIELLKGNFKGI